MEESFKPNKITLQWLTSLPKPPSNQDKLNLDKNNNNNNNNNNNENENEIINFNNLTKNQWELIESRKNLIESLNLSTSCENTKLIKESNEIKKSKQTLSP